METGKYTPGIDLLMKIAEVFEVSTDFLLYDTIAKDGSLNLQDKSLYERMKLIGELDEKDRAIIFGVMDAFLTKRQMWNVLNKELASAK